MLIRLNKWKELQETMLLGYKPTSELTAILIIYFVQGILGLARLAVSFFLKDDLGLTPAEVAGLMGIASIPWVVKPLFGFLSDGLPIFGYRRKTYIVLSGLLGTIAWLSLGLWVDQAWKATMAIALSTLSVVMSDVIADSIVVERAREESLSKSGSLQSLTWGVSALGGLITAYLSGILLEHFSNQTVFGITACFPLIVSIAAWLITEEKTTNIFDTTQIKTQIQQLKKAFTQRAIWMPTAFLFLWQATPSTESAFFYFATNELGFQPEFLGKVRLITSLAALVGIWVFQQFLKTVPFRKIFAITTILSTLFGLTTLILVTHTNRLLGIDDYWFSMGDSLILTVMGQIAYMPVLVLAARLCPPGIEATFFALLMSVVNLALLSSQELGAFLTFMLGVTEKNFDSLWLLIIISNLTSLLPLLLLGWLPAGDPNDEVKEITNNQI